MNKFRDRTDEELQKESMQSFKYTETNLADDILDILNASKMLITQ